MGRNLLVSGGRYGAAILRCRAPLVILPGVRWFTCRLPAGPQTPIIRPADPDTIGPQPRYHRTLYHWEHLVVAAISEYREIPSGRSRGWGGQMTITRHLRLTTATTTSQKTNQPWF